MDYGRISIAVVIVLINSRPVKKLSCISIFSSGGFMENVILRDPYSAKGI